MRELASRILVSKLTLFLRKIDLFFSLLHIVWAVVIIGAPIFMEYDCLIFDIPEAAVILCFAVLSGVSLFTHFYHMAHADDPIGKCLYMGWNLGFPFVYCLITLILSKAVDGLYDFSGVFLGGIGVFFSRLFSLIVTSAVFIVYFIVAIEIKRKRNKGWEPAKRFDKEKVKDIINLSFLGIVIVVLVCFLIYGVFDLIDHKIYENKLQHVREFQDEMTGRMPSGSSFEGVQNESELYATVSVQLANGEISMSDIEGENMRLLVTQATVEGLQKGCDSYKAFTREYEIDGDIINNDSENVTFDADSRTATAHIHIPAKKPTEPYFYACYVNVTYDETWTLKDIEFSTSSNINYIQLIRGYI